MQKRDTVLRGNYDNVKTEKEILTSVHGCSFLISFYSFFQTKVSCLLHELSPTVIPSATSRITPITFPVAPFFRKLTW
jgi:hypothetical protein